MNTFLNAFTYPDRTCYPVASQNLKVWQYFSTTNFMCGALILGCVVL